MSPQGEKEDKVLPGPSPTFGRTSERVWDFEEEDKILRTALRHLDQRLDRALDLAEIERLEDDG
jgi:hypothetical protein